MIDKKQFGKRISILRKKMGLSQVELAEKLNITAQAVSKWECGQALPDLELLLELSWLYDIAINTLFDKSGDMFYKRMSEKAALSDKIKAVLKDKMNEKLISSIAPYFTESENYELASQLGNGNLSVTLSIKSSNIKTGYDKSAEIPLHMLSGATLKEISSVTSETLYESIGISDRGIKRICEIMICPDCKGKLKIKADGKAVECENGHSYKIDDGVIYFNSREIEGELWSLYLRNYEHYLQEVAASVPPVYTRGEVYGGEIKWREIHKRRPRLIVDVACGTGSGIRYILKRINWNCTVILMDLSYRILAWNRRYITEKINNPYVDMVYLACDCSNMPIVDGSVDCVLSTCGFESMQRKMMQGFEESFRILRNNGNAIYDRALISSRTDSNVQKWMRLYQPIINEDSTCFNLIMDLSEWEDICNKIGYSSTDSIQVYGELLAPQKDIFPFENNVLQWMSSYICVSNK